MLRSNYVRKKEARFLLPFFTRQLLLELLVWAESKYWKAESENIPFYFIVHSWTSLRKNPETKTCRKNKSIDFGAFELQWALWGWHINMNNKPPNLHGIFLQSHHTGTTCTAEVSAQIQWEAHKGGAQENKNSLTSTTGWWNHGRNFLDTDMEEISSDCHHNSSWSFLCMKRSLSVSQAKIGKDNSTSLFNCDGNLKHCNLLALRAFSTILSY